MILQELTDRLVVATEEQDVLYVLHWLSEMKEEKCSKSAIDSKHSWKGYSALESLIQSPFSTIRKTILEILLLQGVDGQSKEVLDLAMEKRNTDVLGILLNWDKRGRDEAVDAQRLIEMPLEEAANWIDLHLPPPPNAEHLTGCGDPPAPPSHLPSPPIETRPASLPAPPTPELPLLPSKPFLPESPEQIPTAPAKMRSSPRWKNASNSSPPPARPTSPRKRFVETSSSNWPSSQYLQHSQSYPHSRPLGVRVTRLNLSYIPVNFEQRNFEALFEGIAVPYRIVLYRVSHQPTYAFVDVNSDDAVRTVKELHGASIGGSRMRCKLATSRNPESPPPVQPVESPYRQRSPSIVSQPIGQSLRPPSPVTRTVSSPRPNLLSRHPSPLPELRSSRSRSPLFTNVCVLFNLPLDGPNRRGPAAHLLNGDEVLKFPQHDQSVLIPATRGPSAIDRFERLWDEYLLDGRRLEVVRVKRGSTARQTIEEHFRRLSSAPSDHASISQRSSTASQRSRSRSLSPRRRRT